MGRLKSKKVILVALLLIMVIGIPGSGYDELEQDDIIVMGQNEKRFAPEAENWELNFTIVDTGGHMASPRVSLSEIRVNGRSLDMEEVDLKFEDDGIVPVMDTSRHISKEKMLEYKRFLEQPELAEGLSTAEQEKYKEIDEIIENKIWENPEFARKEYNNAVIIPTEILDIRDNEEYALTVEFDVFGGEQTDTISFDSEITVVSLSPPFGDRGDDDPGDIRTQAVYDGHWVAGDLHVHSTYSDGRNDPEDLMQMHIDAGFSFAYNTDGHHTKELVTDEEWFEMQDHYVSISGPNFSVFPGIETAVNPDDDGHLLVYGTNDTIMGLEENLKNPQEMIDEGVANNPDVPTSTAIAHPECEFFPWQHFNVFGYQGIEIMVGGVPLLHGGTDLNSRHVSRWRSEMGRLQDYIINEGGSVPSARTGTDFHGYPLEIFREWVTWVYVPDPWDSYNYYQKKAAIDGSLYEGITTVSSDGSFGNFRLDGEMVGSVIHGVDPGEALPLEIEYWAASSGDVRVRIFRQNMHETVFDEQVSLGVGDTAEWTDEIVFPGGDHFYWLYAEGPEDVYTTAIYVTCGGYNIELEANPEEGGTVSGAGNYDPGETVTVQAEPHPDYYFHNWTENGEEVSRDETYTFTVEDHRNLTANFRLRLFTFDTSSISAGVTSYAIDEDGNVWGWRDGEPQEYSRDLWGGQEAVDVSTGNSYCREYEYVFVLVEDGSVWSWGSCNYGQLGHGEAEQELDEPVEITSTDWDGFDVVSVHAGNYANHVLAITEDGSLWSWGHFRHTGLPAPEEEFAITVPTRIEQTRYVHGSGALISTSEAWNGENVAFVDVGTSLNIAVTTDGNIWTWGTGAFQLGHGTSHNTMDRPTLMESTDWGGSNVSTVAAGNGYGAALTEDGHVWTWGRSSAGQGEDAGWSVLGHGDAEDRPVPEQITDTNWDGNKVTEIAAGHVHMNALTEDGHVWAWGRNYKGEMGFNDEEDRMTPERIETTDWEGQEVLEISTVRISYPGRALQTGDLYNIALTGDGRIWAWGNLNEELTRCPEQLQ